MPAQPVTLTIVEEVNILRSNPAAYVSNLEEFLDRFVDDYVYKKLNGVKVRTREGTEVVREAIDTLLSTPPLGDLSPSGELQQAALDHAEDSELNDLIGHQGSDGSKTSDRIKKYGNWNKQMGENIRYGNDNAREIIVGMLVDDGVPTRGHRKNLLNPDFNYIGAAMGGHGKYGVCCVVAFAHNFS